MAKTKREYFAELRELVNGNDELIGFIDHEVELLDRKSATPRKATKNQLENAGFKADILEAMRAVGKPVNIKELCGACAPIAGLTNQRVTHMLTDLRKEGKVKRTYVKKVAYFELGNEDEVEG